ncbi:unnamed protein product [Amoebophrya sp. A25]|nr:unnamed protein product [Amoebophrya sp. A25]|eukprot:GSA25T00022019001.1
MTEGRAAPRPAPQDDSSDSDDEPEFEQVKVLVLGDGAVGKTSLIQRFAHDHFGQSYKQTIGVDFCTKRISFPSAPQKQICLQIWDIGGQSIGGKMIASYLHKADAVFLCYDITSYQSFENLRDWLSLVREHCNKQEEEEPYVVLVGTKSDLNHLRAVKAVRHTQFCEMERMHGAYLVSSKMGDGVESMFHKVAADLCDIPLSAAQETALQKPVVAEIIDHPRNDPQHPVASAARGSKGSKSKCAIM